MKLVLWMSECRVRMWRLMSVDLGMELKFADGH